MKRIELYREFQRLFYSFVQTEAMSYKVNEYSTEVRRMRTCVTLYDGKYAVRLTFYISGRYVIEKTERADLGIYETILDKRSLEYIKGNASPALIIGDTIYELFIQFIQFRLERLRRKRKGLEQERSELKKETEGITEAQCETEIENGVAMTENNEIMEVV